MIDHDRALELAASALDFPVSDADRAALQEHLDGCMDCRARDEQLRTDARRVADLPLVSAPDALRMRVLDAAAGLADVNEDGIVAPAAFEDAAARPTDFPDARPPNQIGEPVPGPMLAHRYRRPVAGLFTAAAIVALISGVLFWQSSPNSGPGVAASSPSAAVPSGSGPTSPGGGPSSPIASETWAPVADLTADDLDGGVVGRASSFRLASLDGTSATTLAAHLTVVPPVAFAVVADADGRSARITPNEPLTDGALYRFTLTADDGRTLDSWAFQARQPLHVVSTLPADSESGIPTNTGIEVTFDQDGVMDGAAHMTIEPKIAGRFEQHGRTLAFVPARRLAAGTLYAVTVHSGVTVKGTGEALESDVRFRFETAPPSANGKARTTFQFSDDVVESATVNRPAFALWAFQDYHGDKEPPRPKTARIEVHRLADLEAAISAYRQVRAAPAWARASAIGLVPTKGLDLAASFDAQLRDAGADDGTMWFQTPTRLPAGWYVVTVRSGTRPVQVILQVTDIAGYLAVTETKTLVWANDLASGGPLVGASVASDGVELGRTGADGTSVADTPAGLKPAVQPCSNACWPVVVVRSGNRATFLPASTRSDSFEGGYGFEEGPVQATRYWTTFGTDRTLYRRTDTVNTWGVVRDRDSGTVPASVTIRLFALNEDGGAENGAPLSVAEVHPNAVGAYTGSIALDDLPEGGYVVEASVATDGVGASSFQIDRILKPAYLLDVVTGRRVYFDGDQIKVTATATFYEGSPVPGVPLRADGVSGKTFTTDATGTATLRSTIHFGLTNENSGSEPDAHTVTVVPARAEEGQVAGASRDIVVYPSRWTLDAAPVFSDGQLLVSGHVRAVDRDRLEREIAAGKDIYELDPAGDPIAGGMATVTFVEQIPHRVQTGTRYDFIEKTVVPVYEERTSERAAGAVRVTTGKDGTFTASISAAATGHAYLVRVLALDPDRHQTRWFGVATAGERRPEDAGPGPLLVLSADSSKQSGEFGVGEPIDVTMKDTHAQRGTAYRYLFYTTQRGLRDVGVQTSARYRGTFADWAPPGMWITGVRFTGSGYVESPSFDAAFRKSDRELSVELTTDAPRYDPGAEVSLTVTTRDKSGHPVPATVVLRGVDQKLFTIGGAEAADPLGSLYAEVESGIVATYRSHHEPSSAGDGGGDATGGGGDDAVARKDFRDWVLFKAVDTGQDGRAVVTFRVSDDLTSWRVSASAFAAGPQAGEATIGIPVGLPFFVDATIAPEYLASDRPSIGLRTYGTALQPGTPVAFAVDSDSLGLHVAGLQAEAFGTKTVALPKLAVGSYSLTITATTGSGASARRDVLTRTFSVVSSRLAATTARYIEPTAGTQLDGGKGRVDVIVSDAGAGRYIPLLLELTGGESARMERTLAATLAGHLATDRLGVVGVVPTVDFDRQTYQKENGGVSILPYSTSDLEASVLAALVAPERFDRNRLAGYLYGIAGDGKQTRERRMYALAGLGGLGEAVLPRIRDALKTSDLTVRERLMLGLGAAALGDAATARAAGTSLEAQYSEVTANDARLRVGGSAADSTAATSLMAMLAAANGDPLAARFWSSVAENPTTDTFYGLHAVGFVTRMLERQPPETATFAYTIAGQREVVAVASDKTYHLSLTHDQFASLSIEPVTGRIGVTTTWREPVKASTVAKDPDLRITRKVTPGGTIGASARVTVDLTVTFGSQAPQGCHLATDLVPSGLVPVGNLQNWVDPNDDNPAPRAAEYPSAQVGQRVSFCAQKGKTGVAHLRYFARVVTAGVYTWEPAVVESRTRTGRATLTGQATVTIR